MNPNCLSGRSCLRFENCPEILNKKNYFLYKWRTVYLNTVPTQRRGLQVAMYGKSSNFFLEHHHVWMATAGIYKELCWFTVCRQVLKKWNKQPHITDIYAIIFFYFSSLQKIKSNQYDKSGQFTGVKGGFHGSFCPFCFPLISCLIQTMWYPSFLTWHFYGMGFLLHFGA